MRMFSVSISYYSYLLYEEACHNNRWKSQVWAKPLCFKNNPFSCFNIFIIGIVGIEAGLLGVFWIFSTRWHYS